MNDLSELTNEQLLELAKATEQQIAEFHNKQQALKILLNGGYGALSNEHNRWYSDDVAESITLSGQLSARWIIQHLNRFFNRIFRTTDTDYVVACDTDSVHLNLQPALDDKFGSGPIDEAERLQFLLQISNKLDQVINEGYQLLYEEVNAFDKAMHMKFEAISRAVWTGKKHYAMSISIGESKVHYTPPKLKIVGLEAVRSSTPQVCRDWIRQAIPYVLQDDTATLKQFIEEKRVQHAAMKFEQVASPRSVSDVDKYSDSVTIYGKKTPPAVRGALLYNHMVSKMKLGNVYPPIQNGDKVRFCYLKMPNPLNENIFACPDTLPTEFGLDQYIDYSTQFEKTFVEPVRSLIDAAKMIVTDDIDITQFFEV